jgi:hypothetical protein
MPVGIKHKGVSCMNKKLNLLVMLVCILVLGLVFAGCSNGTSPGDITDGGSDAGDDIDDEDDELLTASYTYTSGVYVMTITKTISAKSIYPRSVLSEGETASYTLKYNGVVVSTGHVLMGTTGATFTPSSGKPPFSGTLSGDSGLAISQAITLDDGTIATFGEMKEADDRTAAFAEYWGIWKTNIEGTNIRLTIGDGDWDIWIGPMEHDIGTYTQTSATTADIFQTNYGFNGMKIGHVETGPNITMIITLYGNTAYPGTYHLTRPL